jgi:anion-transporting  ArsA/GET3 family ATPase
MAMYYRLGRATRALDRFGVIDFATTLAPGVRDILLTGKVYEATERSSRNKNARTYSAVVLDAPPTGRIANFLNVNAELSDLARMGPIKAQADRVMKLLRSKRTAIHVVTLLEDMPVQETIDATRELEAAGLPGGGIIVNMTRPPSLDEEAVDLARAAGIPWETVADQLTSAGIEASDSLLVQLASEASDHAERLLLEQEERTRLAALARPTYELNRLADGVDLGGLYDLAASLTDQGLS